MGANKADLPEPELAELCATAERAARAAGAVALRGFRGPMEVRSKGGKDIVTEFDTAAEEAAILTIRDTFPSHSILAEEGGTSHVGEAQAPWLWTVDPIDGTHNYAAQLPFWCVSVAVADAEGRVRAGAVFDALHDEMFLAQLGGGAYLNGTPMKVSSTARPEDAFLATDIGYEQQVARQMLSMAPWIHAHVKRLRLLGSAVLAMTYVAAGRLDGYYHLSLQPWDIAAASLLIEEAGGIITDWAGKELAGQQSGAIAANATLQPQVLALLQEGRRATSPGS